MAKESNIIEYTFQDTICYGHKPNYFSLLRMLLKNDSTYIVQLYRFSQYCNMRKTFIYTILRKIGMRKFYTLTEKYPLFLEVRTEIGEGLFSLTAFLSLSILMQKSESIVSYTHVY